MYLVCTSKKAAHKSTLSVVLRDERRRCIRSVPPVVVYTLGFRRLFTEMTPRIGEGMLVGGGDTEEVVGVLACRTIPGDFTVFLATTDFRFGFVPAGGARLTDLKEALIVAAAGLLSGCVGSFFAVVVFVARALAFLTGFSIAKAVIAVAVRFFDLGPGLGLQSAPGSGLSEGDGSCVCLI
jgi:hypothetical protein